MARPAGHAIALRCAPRASPRTRVRPTSCASDNKGGRVSQAVAGPRNYRARHFSTSLAQPRATPTAGQRPRPEEQSCVCLALRSPVSLCPPNPPVQLAVAGSPGQPSACSRRRRDSPRAQTGAGCCLVPALSGTVSLPSASCLSFYFPVPRANLSLSSHASLLDTHAQTVRRRQPSSPRHARWIRSFQGMSVLACFFGSVLLLVSP